MRRYNSLAGGRGVWQSGRRSRSSALFCVSLSLLCAAGCGDKNRGTVTGLVTLDGTPLAVGSIQFIPQPVNTGRATGAAIQDGEYRLEGDAAPLLGTYRVEIRSTRKTGRMVQKPMAPAGEMGEETVQAIAAEYNDQSTLTFEVQSGKNEANWDVESREEPTG